MTVPPGGADIAAGGTLVISWHFNNLQITATDAFPIVLPVIGF